MSTFYQFMWHFSGDAIACSGELWNTVGSGEDDQLSVLDIVIDSLAMEYRLPGNKLVALKTENHMLICQRKTLFRQLQSLWVS